MPGLVWENEYWWRILRERWDMHDPLPDEADSSIVRYYSSPEKAALRIRAQIKAGRYLTKYFSDVLSEKHIKFYSEWQSNGMQPGTEKFATDYDLKFATDPDDIVRVYQTCVCHSCMDGRHFKADLSPVRVYGSGDLAVAYLERREQPLIRARCLVRPDAKIASRVYPTVGMWSDDGFQSREESAACNVELVRRLKAEGYAFVKEKGSDGFRGARLLKLPWPRGDAYKDRYDRFLMPYFDCCSTLGARDDGDHWVLVPLGYGGYPLNDTGGYIAIRKKEPLDAGH